MGKNTWSVFRGFCHHYSVSSDPRAVSCSHKARPGAGASVLSHRTTSCSEWAELSGLRIMFAPRAWNSVAAELEFETASSRQRWLEYSLFLLLSFPIFLFLTHTHRHTRAFWEIKTSLHYFGFHLLDKRCLSNKYFFLSISVYLFRIFIWGCSCVFVYIYTKKMRACACMRLSC